MAKPPASRTPITLDAHIDIPWIVTKIGEFDLEQDNEGRYSEVDFPRMKRGGLDSAIFALYLSDEMQDRLGKDKSLEAIAAQYKFIEKQEGCVVVEDPEVAIDCHTAGFTPIFFALEGGRLIYESLALLGKYRQIGVRYMTVTHNRNTKWADSATDVPSHNGLTTFGKQVIHEANRLGILMDVSHASDDTAKQVISESNLPVLATHSGARKLLDHPRNLSDEIIKRIAQTNGVVCVPFARRFIGPDWKGIVDHVEYLVHLTDSFSVGIGSDLDGAELTRGIEDVTDWKRVVVTEMKSRGFTDAAIERIAGGNLLRVLKQGLK